MKGAGDSSDAEEEMQSNTKPRAASVKIRTNVKLAAFAELEMEESSSLIADSGDHLQVKRAKMTQISPSTLSLFLAVHISILSML